LASLDELTGLTRVRREGAALLLLPMQGTARTLVPVGGVFFRAEDRREATHALLRSAGDLPIITDGLRTFERVSPLTVYFRWASAVAGLGGLLHLLIAGGVRTALSLGRGTWRGMPLRWPALGLALLLLAPALYLTQSFLALGDPTPANLAVAALTGLLPVTLVVAAVQTVRAGLRTRRARLDFVALAGALQWCVVLAAWGLLPFALWR